ncbi:MAG: DegT/DnrJ/EryC1/StrS family aminotransferase [Pyrinomonadaceae bacterium]
MASTTSMPEPMPFLDLLREYREIETEINAALARTLAHGSYILGPEVEAFENDWAAFCGVAAAAGVANGTDAVALALIASGAVRPGRQDEVITSPLTAGYTALAIQNAGGVPVFADIDPQTLLIDPKAIEKSITPRTRAIVPVHLYGQLAEMDSIVALAARHNLLVIEDAAQAHGAMRYGKRAGAHGTAAAFSFYPTKNLGAYGDGGAVVSNNPDLIKRVKRLRTGGHPASVQQHLTGMNSRLDEIQAAILRVKLKKLAQWNKRRQQLAGHYNSGLARAGVEIPVAQIPGSHVYHLYVVQHSDRDGLRKHLAQAGIETLIHYPFLLHQQALFLQPVSLPAAERAVKRILSLPLYPALHSHEIRRVIDAVTEF